MQNVVINQILGPGIRVTVVMGTDRNLSSGITSASILAICDLYQYFLLFDCHILAARRGLLDINHVY